MTLSSDAVIHKNTWKIEKVQNPALQSKSNQWNQLQTEVESQPWCSEGVDFEDP